MPSVIIQGDHPTSNLNGYHALDLGAPAGTMFFSAFGGKVLSAHPNATQDGSQGKGGWNLLVQDYNGTKHFLTHFASLKVKAGDTILPGTALGPVWDGQGIMTPHIHWGTTRGNPVDAGYITADGSIVQGGQSSGIGSFISNIFEKIKGDDISKGPLPGQDASDVPRDFAKEVLAIVKDYLFGDAKAWGLRLVEIMGGVLLLILGLSKITGIKVPRPPMPGG